MTIVPYSRYASSIAAYWSFYYYSLAYIKALQYATHRSPFNAHLLENLFFPALTPLSPKRAHISTEQAYDAISPVIYKSVGIFGIAGISSSSNAAYPCISGI